MFRGKSYCGLFPLIFLDLKMLSTCYYTNYSTTGDVKLAINRPYKNVACFQQLYYELHGKQTINYQIYIYKTPQAGYKEGNTTLLTKPELYNFIKSTKNLFPFSFRIEENKDYYIVHAKLTGDRIHHKYLTTWIRYTYEYPYNICCLNIMQMRKTHMCDYINTPNLMHSYMMHHGFNCGHAIIKNWRSPELVNYEGQKAALKNCSDLNRLHKECDIARPNRFTDCYSEDRNEQLKGWEDRAVKVIKYYKQIYKK